MQIDPPGTPDTSAQQAARSPYWAHEAFVAPARNTSLLGALFLGIFIIELLNGFLLNLLSKFLLSWSDGFAQSVFRGDSPMGLVVQLCSFALLTLSVVLVVRRRHGRGFFSLVGPPMTALRHFRTVAMAVALLLLVLEILPPWWSLPLGAEIRAPVLWGLLMPLSLFALLIQTSAEEIFYRGYIQQQIAARFNRPIIWLIAPNILFAMSHFDNATGGAGNAAGMQYVIWAFCFGVAASDLTGRTGNIGAAVGFHLVNNAYAFLFFGELGGPDSGLALLLFPAAHYGGTFAATAEGSVLSLSLAIEISIIGCMWLAARVALRR